jgi:hypothetical protein
VKRLALALAVVHAAAGIAAADAPPAPPPWMPSAPPPESPTLARHVRQLRHEAAVFGGVGLGLMAAGIAVDVVALDLPQGERQVPLGGGVSRIDHYRNDANWAEFAVGSGLIGIGFALSITALFRLQRARQLGE